jgi:hypothetical protein
MAMEYDDDNLRNSTIEPNKRKVGGYTYASTGKRYTGKIVEYGGRMFTTTSGTYEGHVSKEVVWTNEIEKLNIVLNKNTGGKGSRPVVHPYVATSKSTDNIKRQIKVSKQLLNSKIGTDQTERLAINRTNSNREMYGGLMKGKRNATTDVKVNGEGKRPFRPNSFSNYKSTPNVRKRFNKVLDEERKRNRTTRRGKLKKSPSRGVFRDKWRG